MRLEVEGEEVGGQILPHFYCEDMMNVMNKVKIVREMIMLMRSMRRLLVFGNGDCDNKVFFFRRDGERRCQSLLGSSRFVIVIFLNVLLSLGLLLLSSRFVIVISLIVVLSLGSGRYREREEGPSWCRESRKSFAGSFNHFHFNRIVGV